jgi:hypothetical protein
MALHRGQWVSPLRHRHRYYLQYIGECDALMVFDDLYYTGF